MKKHFVTFYSPGTFVAETSAKDIGSWNVDDAVAMSAMIEERHGARPYGFRFTTRERGDDDFDSKETAQSPMYYLGGKVETLEEVEARNDPEEQHPAVQYAAAMGTSASGLAPVAGNGRSRSRTMMWFWTHD
jgi:hypothetical protein